MSDSLEKIDSDRFDEPTRDELVTEALGEASVDELLTELKSRELTLDERAKMAVIAFQRGE